MTRPTRRSAMRARGSCLLVVLLAAGCVGPDAEPTNEDETLAPAGDAAVGGAPGTAAPPPTNATDADALPALVDFALKARSVGLYPVNPSYEMSHDEVPTGAVVTVTYRNDDLNPLGRHDWVLEGVDGSGTAVIPVGEEAMGRFVAPAPGEYTYFCSVDGHRERGMEGVLRIV